MTLKINRETLLNLGTQAISEIAGGKADTLRTDHYSVCVLCPDTCQPECYETRKYC